ncbi:MAG: hydantoinase/oxoprolinase family protein, partial [Dehalococcoidia bacterium]|nr:hydantoinase/oxoprolinase family protein [Dehalococcoidia bacterium]
MEYVIGIDTGGTFTDVVAIDGEGKTITGKAPTTAENLSEGIMNALEDIARQVGVGLGDLLAETKIFKFSGTIATNTLLTRTGAKTGLITTAGFEDTLYIARSISAWAGLSEEEVRHVYRQEKPEPLVPKSLVRGVTERVDWKGSEVCVLDTEEVRQAARSLAAEGVRSIAVCFMWSVRNGAHEAEAERIIAEECPGVYLSVSHKVAPSLGEYERFTTTVINAYLGPVVAGFLSGLQKTLREKGFKGQALVMQAHGGCVYPHEALPVHTIQSGPSAGVIASKNEGQVLGHSNVMTTDVGGTSFDVGLVAEGSWIYAREPVIGKFHVSFPIIEVVSIGAGGGSVAWVDQLGVLHVGPQSAGAHPGPACYGQGGTEATVTDADLVLGYLNPDYFLGGRMKLYPDKAREAIQKLAERIGMDVTRTAAGIFEIANAHMAGLLTSHVVGRGHDPRDFVVFAYGGAGGMHTAFYAAEAGVQEVVVPAAAATYSALGAATADLLHSAQSYDFVAMPMDPDRFNGNFKDLEAQVKE